MKDIEQRKDLALRLIWRASSAPGRMAAAIEHSQQSDEYKLNRALQILEALLNVIDEQAPDAGWFRDHCLVTGEHAVLTEEGWVPAEFNTWEVTGSPPMKVLDEVNAPERSREPQAPSL